MESFASTGDLEQAIRALGRIEPRFHAVHQKMGTPSLRQAPADLEGLLAIVTDQFLSLQAAAAIWARVRTVLDPFTPENILAATPEDLKALGLSNAKLRTFHAAASAVSTGSLDFAALRQMPDSEIHKALCALPGVGPWTADIFLLANLQRRDAWPVGDLALQLSAQNLFELEQRPSPSRMAAMAETWKPHRAAAARLLWGHYRLMKGIKQA